MKKTRRILSLILSLLMIFSSVAILAEETTTTSMSFTDVEAGSKTADAITKLVAHGIMNGYPDGTFKPDGSITRAEVAAVIVRFKKLANDLPADAVTGFADLDKDDTSAWARPYVKAAVDAGIINGFEDGTYRASEPVTYEQVIKMIICAIGYDVIATSEKSKLEAMGQTTTWSSGYIAAANKYGITASALMANVTMPASRGIVSLIASNALDAPVLNVVTDKDGNISYEMGDTSVGEEGRDNLDRIEGYVSGTYYTSLTTQAPGLSLSQLYITTNGTEKRYDLSAEVKNQIDIEDILGKRIVAYYSAIDRQITTLSVSNLNAPVIIKDTDIKGISGSTVTYGKNDSFSLDSYVVIYNGKYVDSATAQTLMASFDNGQIELIEGDVKIAKVTSYLLGVAKKGYTTSNNYIYFKYSTTNEYYEYKPGEFDAVYYNGTKKDPSGITFSEYDVINVMESPAGAAGNSLKKMYITRKTASGTVTMTTSSSRAVVLNGTTYYITNAYNNFAGTPAEPKAPFEINSNYTCYLDHTGQIAAVNYSLKGSGDYNYGYYLYTDSVKKDGYTYEAQIVCSDGKVRGYYLKNRVTLDGTDVNDEDIANIATLAEFTPVRYKIKSSSGFSELVAIDTAVTGDRTQDDYLKKTYKKEDGAFTVVNKGLSLSRGGDTFRVSSSTKIIYVPHDRNDTSSYSKLEKDTIFKSGTHNVDVFDVDASTASFVIVYGAEGGADPTYVFDDNSPFMIVTEKIGGLDGKIKFTGYKYEKSTASKEPSQIDVLIDDGYKVITGAIADPDLVGEGDIIRYVTNSDGQIVSLMIWYDASAPVQEGVATNITDAKTTYERYRETEGGDTKKFFTYGTVLYKDTDNNMVVGYFTDSDNLDADTTDSIDNDDKFKDDPTQSQIVKIGGATIYGKNSEGQIVVVDANSIRQTSGATVGSKVIVIWYSTQNLTAKVVYILD